MLASGDHSLPGVGSGRHCLGLQSLFFKIRRDLPQHHPHQIVLQILLLYVALRLQDPNRNGPVFPCPAKFRCLSPGGPGHPGQHRQQQNRHRQKDP